MAGSGRWSGLAASFAVGLSLAACLLSFRVAAAAEDEEPFVPSEAPWRIVLEDQLKKEKNCDLKELLMYQEIPLGDEIAVEGRVSCLDERAFDFSRRQTGEKFRIELCAPAAC